MKEETESQLKYGIFLNYLNLILGSLIPLFYTPIMLSILGQEEYGLYKLSGSVTSYLSLISLGLGTAITRYLIKFRIENGQEAEERILGLFVIIFRIVAIASFVIGIFLILNLNRWYGTSLSEETLSKMRVLVFILVCNMSVSFLLTPYISVVNSHEKYIFLECLNICSTVLVPFVNIIVLYMGYSSIGLAMSSLMVSVIFRFVYHYYVKFKMSIKVRYSKPTKVLLKDILSFSFWVFVSNIIGQLYGTTDIVMIGLIPALATSGVAIYSVGEIFTAILASLNAGISSLLIPKANRMVFRNASNEELTNISIKIARIQCYILALVVGGFISFGKPFIHFYIGDNYSESYWVAILCMIPTTIPLLQSFCLNILIAKNKNKFRALSYLFIALLNVVGTWFLLKYWGVVGAAAVTCFSMFLGHGLLMNWYYKVKIGINIKRFWFKIGQILLIPCLLSIITLNFYSILDFYNIWNLISGICIFTILYICLNWKFVMNEFEKQLIKNYLNFRIK